MSRKEKIETEIEIFDNIFECPVTIQDLMQSAREIREKAYAPYSNFLVGAAILLEDGTIVTGSNQENASYPAGLCAERTALFYAGANYPGLKIKSIALTAGPKGDNNINPVPPCGSCRQAIAEYEQNQKTPISIYFMGTSGQVKKVESLLSLLPLAFNKAFLEVD
jgi:cytidine deaminase